jgi:murein hydrolase activator
MGRMVVIDHQDGYYSVYAHLGSLDVSRGQTVDAGAPLGSSGPLPGGRNGCYLEIRRAGAPVDPMEYLVHR